MPLSILFSKKTHLLQQKYIKIGITKLTNEASFFSLVLLSAHSGVCFFIFVSVLPHNDNYVVHMTQRTEGVIMKKISLILAIVFLTASLLCLTSCGGPSFEYTEMEEGYAVSGRGNVTDTDLVIPDSYRGKPVVCVYKSAFANCTDITSVTLPDSVIQISTLAFDGCISLKAINVPASLTSISAGAFRGCSSLEKFDLPDNLEFLAKDAFKGSPLMETQGNVNYVGNWAVSVENELESESVIIREGTVGVASGAFYRSGKKLKEVSLPNTIKAPMDVLNVDYSGITFHFNGTKAEWQKICKNWDSPTASMFLVMTIICTDETIVYGQ